MRERIFDEIDMPRPRNRLAAKLRAMGHTVTIGGAQGDANSIVVDAGGTAWGANDKRSADGKVSVAGARLTSTAAKR